MIHGAVHHGVVDLTPSLLVATMNQTLASLRYRVEKEQVEVDWTTLEFFHREDFGENTAPTWTVGAEVRRVEP